MKYNKILCLILPLCLFIYGCKGIKNKFLTTQTNYTYNAENFGYNDIKKLYHTDSLVSKVPFFSSKSLQHIEMTIQSHMQKTILKQSKDSILICFQLQNPKLVIQNQGVSVHVDNIIEEILKPVFVQSTIQGKITTIQFYTIISDITLGLYKDILSKIQFVKPKGEIKNWETKEDNTLGSYIAQYKHLNTTNYGKVYKKNIYKYVLNPTETQNQNTNINHITTIETNTSGDIKKIQTSEAQVTLKNNDTISVLGAKVALEINAKKQINNSYITQLLNLRNSAKYNQKTSLSTTVSDDEIRKIAYTNTLDGDTWQTLQEKLIDPKYFGETEKKDLTLKLRALFYLQPEKCNKAVSFLDSKLVSSNAFQLISYALSITETYNATSAIAVLVLKHKTNSELMSQLIPSLTTTKYPSDKAVQVLKKISFIEDNSIDEFTSATAQLALGGIANNFRELDPLKANELSKYLIEKMKFEQDTIQRILVMANTKSSIVFPYIKTLIDKKSSQQIKLEAISALGSIESREVSNYLSELSTQKDTIIKKRAKEILELKNTTH